jgi:hypothetical protein
MSLVGDGYGSVFAAGNRALREAMMEQEAKRRENFLLDLKVQEMNRQALKDEQDARERQEDRAYGRQRDQKADADKERDRVAKQTREQRPGSKQELPGLAALDTAGLGSFVTNRNPGVAVQAGVPQDVLAFLPQSDPVSNAPVAPEVGPQDVAPAPVVAFEGGASGDYMGSPEYVEQTRREGVLKAQQDLQREDAQTQARELQAERLASQQFIASENAAMRRDIAEQGRLNRGAQAASQDAGVRAQLGVAAQERLSGMQSSLDTLKTMEEVYAAGAKDFVGPAAGRWERIKLMLPDNDIFKPAKGAATFSAFSATLENAMIKAITGAQMSEPEARRITRQIPKIDDRNDVWEAKAGAVKQVMRYMAYRTAANAQGVSKEDLDKELLTGNGGGPELDIVRQAILEGRPGGGGSAASAAKAGSFRVIGQR